MKSKKKSSRKWGSLPAIPGMKIGRDIAARMCFLPYYPIYLLFYAFEHSLPLRERNHLIGAYEKECLELLRLIKDFCADELCIHKIADRVSLYNEWEKSCNSLIVYLRKVLKNKKLNLNEAYISEGVKLSLSSLFLVNKAALLGRISRREVEKSVNMLFAKIDVSKLPIEFQNYIRETDDDQLQHAVRLETMEGKSYVPLKWMKRFKHQLENTPCPDLASDTNNGVEGNEKKIKPIDLNEKQWWDCKNLRRLRDIDSNPKRDGIPGNQNMLKHLRTYIGKTHKRKDIANTLGLNQTKDRILTSMQYKTMFLQK